MYIYLGTLKRNSFIKFVLAISNTYFLFVCVRFFIGCAYGNCTDTLKLNAVWHTDAEKISFGRADQRTHLKFCTELLNLNFILKFFFLDYLSHVLEMGHLCILENV